MTTIDHDRLTVAIHAEGMATVLEISGIFDLYSELAVDAQVDQLLMTQPSAVILDASRLRSIDAEGLRALHRLVGKIEAFNGTFTIRGARPPISERLHRAGFTH